VILEDEFSFVYVKHNNVYLMAMTKRNANVMLIAHYLVRLTEVMEDYFSELNEESIKDNFVRRSHVTPFHIAPLRSATVAM
jgi:AP-1 complex subunit mu